MAQRTLSVCEEISWQEELRQLITCPEELLKALNLPTKHVDSARKACALFPLRVTRTYLNAMQKGRQDDPLLLQVLPLGYELENPPEYSDTPLAEDKFTPVPGLIHKYQGRVLLIFSTQCAINCRYCFRRNFDYKENARSQTQWLETLTYIKNNHTIEEVILSGGDPLTASDKQLSWLIQQLEEIPHIERLRIHSRLPIVLPSRITPELLTALTQSRLNTTMVVHCNHPNEISPSVVKALKLLQSRHITVFNQAVLLKNINDCAKILSKLSKVLFSYGVVPYYLHILDKVSGAAHFDVDLQQAKAIHKEMTESLSGYLVPRLVTEVPHARSKITIV